MTDYETEFKKHVAELLAWERVGDYQGKYYALFRIGNGMYGFCKIHYGSCSVCDPLEACQSQAEINKMFREIVNGAAFSYYVGALIDTIEATKEDFDGPAKVCLEKCKDLAFPGLRGKK